MCVIYRDSGKLRADRNTLFPRSHYVDSPQRNVIVNRREFKQIRRRRQRERHKTIRFNEQNNTLHVCYKFWYISSPSSAKQQRKMTKFKVL